MPRKSAEVIPLNQSAVDKNWRGLLARAMGQRGIRGVALVAFYRDGTHSAAWSGLRSGERALAGARLLRVATDDD